MRGAKEVKPIVIEGDVQEMWRINLERQWKDSGTKFSLEKFLGDKKYECLAQVRSVKVDNDDYLRSLPEIQIDELFYDTLMRERKRELRSRERLLNGLEDHVRFLEVWLNEITQQPKTTPNLNKKEKYELLSQLGLFETPIWRAILSNNKKGESELLLSEILQCDTTTARNMINRKKDYVVSEEKRKIMEDRIKLLQKGV